MAPAGARPPVYSLYFLQGTAAFNFSTEFYTAYTAVSTFFVENPVESVQKSDFAVKVFNLAAHSSQKGHNWLLNCLQGFGTIGTDFLRERVRAYYNKTKWCTPVTHDAKGMLI